VLVALVPAEVVTVTSTVSSPAGEIPVIEESLLSVKEAALRPKLTELEPVNPVSVIVTVVPPLPSPLVGEIEVIAGAVVAAAQEAVTIGPSTVN